MNFKKIVTVMLLLLAGSVYTACEQNDGAFEEAGEQMDQSVDNAKDAVEEAGDEIEDATDQ